MKQWNGKIYIYFFIVMMNILNYIQIMFDLGLIKMIY